MIANSITTINNKSATLPFVITADSIKPNPTAWSCFAFAG
jgi:hypothetical protein